jgi:mannosyl-3-phosphoglycerate phosphatase
MLYNEEVMGEFICRPSGWEKSAKARIIIFTDLDGTLLDSSYSFKKALPALKLIEEENIPLILCSSKTRSEIEHCRRQLKNNHPFISENGGGIFVPRRYSGFRFQGSGIKAHMEGDYHVIKLGADYSELRNALAELREEGFDVTGFGDMSIREVSELTGLKPADAKRARERDFDEPFVLYPPLSPLTKGGKGALLYQSRVTKLKRRIKQKGFNYTQGEFFHIMGDSDKGRAVEIVKKLYLKKFGKIITVALGDSPNDIEMLRSVDCPIIVMKKDGSYDKRIRVRNLIKANGIGPEGWNRAVKKVVSEIVNNQR